MSAEQQTKERIEVPEILHDVLLDFSVSYLLEQPEDVIDYAVEYFTKLQKIRNKNYATQTSETLTPDEEHSQDEESTIGPRFLGRRKSVFAESYDPEKDSDDDNEDYLPIIPKTDEQRARLKETVKHILLFRSLDVEQINQVLNAMFEKRVVKDEYVIRQGDDGDNFYVIESGKYKAYVNGKHIHTYENSGSFGELALLYNVPRAATIIAETEGNLWAVDRQTFRRILLKSAFKKRKMYETLIDSVPMLKKLQSYERMILADALVSKTFKKGEKIIEQGDVANGMYFIEDGAVSIQIEESGKTVEVTTLYKGSYFGEMALVEHKPRAASAYAASDIVTVAFLDTEAFERLLGPCMEILKRKINSYEIIN